MSVLGHILSSWTGPLHSDQVKKHALALLEGIRGDVDVVNPELALHGSKCVRSDKVFPPQSGVSIMVATLYVFKNIYMHFLLFFFIKRTEIYVNLTLDLNNVFI